MKTFNDLQFEKNYTLGGVKSRMFFENGYGVSVIRNQYSYGGESGLYELAVLNKDGKIVYDTPITHDVLGWLSKEEVTSTMEKVQKL